jgi:hypothetical protein
MLQALQPDEGLKLVEAGRVADALATGERPSNASRRMRAGIITSAWPWPRKKKGDIAAPPFLLPVASVLFFPKGRSDVSSVDD